MVELRRYQRAPIDVAVEFVAKGSAERVAGRAKDISLGGMFVETPAPLPFGAELVVHVTLPGQKSPFALPGRRALARRRGDGRAVRAPRRARDARHHGADEGTLKSTGMAALPPCAKRAR